MAAPTPTPRETPVGIPLRNGFSAKVTLALAPAISFWEKEVTPMGFTTGDKIPTSTMHNQRRETYAPHDLIEATDGGGTAAYDPQIILNIFAAMGVETVITYKFRDGSLWAEYGFMNTFTPAALAPRTQPEAELGFCHTGWDYVNGEEAAPALTNVPGS